MRHLGPSNYRISFLKIMSRLAVYLIISLGRARLVNYIYWANFVLKNVYIYVHGTTTNNITLSCVFIIWMQRIVQWLIPWASDSEYHDLVLYNDSHAVIFQKLPSLNQVNHPIGLFHEPARYLIDLGSGSGSVDWVGSCWWKTLLLMEHGCRSSSNPGLWNTERLGGFIWHKSH